MNDAAPDAAFGVAPVSSPDTTHDSTNAREKTRVLLLEGINQSAVDYFLGAGFAATERVAHALSGEPLAVAVRERQLLGIRSRTELTADVLAQANGLLAVGCFSVGTNQVDLDSARARGIPVFNAPFSNTRSVAELTIGEIVMLFRQIFPRSQAAHQGGWEKSAAGSHEVRGKTLGIVGYGNIGSQLSTLAEAMGMRAIYYDRTDKLRHGNTEPTATLADLLAQSDVVTLHVPDTVETQGMIGAAQLAAMKQGACLINNSRGSVVDLDALAASLRSGHLAGAAVDVFPVEPASNKERFTTPLQGLPNVILTPHVGGSTEEAQDRIGAEVSRKLVEYCDTGTTTGSVNFPQVQLPRRIGGARYTHLHRNMPGMLGRLNDLFSSYQRNIAAQYLQTDGDLGYVVLDVEAGHNGDDMALLRQIQAIPGTVGARLLFDHPR